MPFDSPRASSYVCLCNRNPGFSCVEDADGCVVAARDEDVSMCCDGADRVRVAAQDPDKVRALGVISGRARLDVPSRSCLGQPPYSQLAVSGPGDDEGVRWHHHRLAIQTDLSGISRHEDL